LFNRFPATHSDVDADADEENEFEEEEEEEVNMGGMSQTMLEICDKAECSDEDMKNDSPADEVLSPVDEERALAMKALFDAQNPPVAKVMAQSKKEATSDALDGATLNSKEDDKADSPAAKEEIKTDSVGATVNSKDDDKTDSPAAKEEIKTENVGATVNSIKTDIAGATVNSKEEDKADSPASKEEIKSDIAGAALSSKDDDKADSPAAKDEFKTDIGDAEEPSTPKEAQDGADEKDFVPSETQAINAIETQSPIDRSNYAKAASTTDSAPRAKPARRNIGIVGKTTNKIRNGEAGRTTFSAFDLPMPKRKNNKK